MAIVINGIQFDELTADPGSPIEGESWYNATDKAFRVFRDGVTVDLVAVFGAASDGDVPTWVTANNRWEPQMGVAGGSNPSGYDDIMEFGDSSKSVKDKFLKSSITNHNSADSTCIALRDGEVVHVSISTEEDETNNWFVQVVKNATKAGAGVFQGGTQVGTDLEKDTAVLDKFHRDLSGFTFSADDRIAVYAKAGTLGNTEAVEPAVRLFIKYDAPA